MRCLALGLCVAILLLACPLRGAEEGEFVHPSLAEGGAMARMALNHPGEILSPQAMATGEARRGLGLGNEAIALNPAGMSQAAVYHIEAMYQYGQALSLNGFHISIVDSKTQAVAVGLSYSYVDSTVDDISRAGHNARVALAMGLAKWLYLGLGGRYLYMDIEGTEGINAATMDVAALVRPLPYLSFGVVGHNIIYIGTPEAPITLGVGAAFGMAGFSLDVDWVVDFTTLDHFDHEFHLGAQYFLLEMIPISAGYVFDLVRDRQFFSVGLGFVSSQIGLDVAFRQQTEEPENRYLGVSLKIFL